MAPELTNDKASLAARVIGALAIAGTAVIHLEQYFHVYYHVIPIIGPLFLVNFIAGVALAVALLLPIRKRSEMVWQALALSGLVYAAVAIFALEISERDTLFGFHEHGYRTAIVLSIALEGATVVALAGSLIFGRAPRVPAADDS